MTYPHPVDSQCAERFQAIDPQPPRYDLSIIERGHPWRWVAVLVVIAAMAIGAVISL